MSNGSNFKAELERIRRVSDMLCTGHSGLRDRFTRYALALDLSTLAASTWLVALSFVDPLINASLTPFRIAPQIWIGILGAVTFFLTVVQLKTDWKSRADAHRRTANLYAEVKRESGYLLAHESVESVDYNRVVSRYDMASAAGVELPERDFLTQKKRHKVKLELSRYLDRRPFASLLLIRVRMFIRDNFGRENDDSQL